MQKRTRRAHISFVLGTFLTFLLVLIFSPEPAPDLRMFLPLSEKYDVQIMRDTFGVPHIFGKTDPDAAFGLAYAHSEDDFKTIQEVVLAARGTLAAVYGPDAAPVDYFVRLMRVWDVVDSRYETDLTPETRALLEAYADGLNYYAAQHPDELLTPDLLPVTGKDMAAGSVQRSPLFFGLDGTLASLFEDTRQSDISAGPVGWRAPFPNDYEAAGGDYGSNVFALAPSRTPDGSTFLAVNAHQPWEGPVAWYEAHVHSEEGWDMTGALFPGAPLIIHGHNRNLGWGFTVNHPDLTDVYVLEVNPENENQYRYDGQWLDFEVRRQPIRVRILGRLVVPVQQEFLWSVHGPVVRRPHGTYALRFPGFGRVDIFQQLYRMNRAENFAEWQAAMRDSALPMFNVGYADDAGNIYYLYNSMLPIRQEGWDWEKYLPGNRSDLVWTEILPFDDLPQVLNPPSGFILNANSSPFWASGTRDQGEEQYSPDFGIETYQTNRALRLIELLSGAPSIDLAGFIGIKWDMAYSSSSDQALFMKQFAGMTFQDPELEAARGRLLAWNLETNPENTDAALPMLTLYFLNQNYPALSASQLATGKKAPEEALRKSFSQAIDHLLTHFGRLDVPWGAVNRLRRGSLDLPIGGGPDIVHAVYGSFEEDGRLRGFNGDGLVYIVRWLPDGSVESYSIHQYGSATLRPDSPHYADQSPLFVTRRLKPAWFDQADILANLESIYRP